MEDKIIKELKEQLDALKVEVNNLKSEVEKIKNSEFATGIYLDGCQDAVADYIKEEKGSN